MVNEDVFDKTISVRSQMPNSNTSHLGGPSVLDVLADLVVRDESLFAGVSAGGASALSGSSHAGLGLVDEGESSAVGSQSHDELVGGKSLLDEVVDGPVDVEGAVVSGLVGSGVEGDMGAGVLLPGAVEIVGHQVDEVHFLAELGDFVGGIDRGFTAADGGGEEEALFAGGSGFGFEGLGWEGRGKGS